MSKLIYACAFVLVGMGFLLPLWPLCAAGILLAALTGRYFFALLLGVLLDVAWGPPAGILHYLYLPFVLLALVASLLRYFFAGYFLDRTPPDTL